MDRSRGVVRGRLELGTTDAASIYVLPEVYRTFRERYPQVELSVRVEGTESLLRQLRERAIEVAIVSLTVGGRSALPEGAGLETEPLYREELPVILSGAHPLASREEIGPEDLADVPFITFKEESVTRRAAASAFAAAGIRPNIAMEISSPEAIKKLVEAGLGASILPAGSVAAEVRAGTLATPRVRGVKLDRVLGIVRDPRRSPSPALTAFLELLAPVRNADPR